MKLHYNTVSQLLTTSLSKLMSAEEFLPFRLVGGTALSLQLGHRLSIDIDLFSDYEYKSNNALLCQKEQQWIKGTSKCNGVYVSAKSVKATFQGDGANRYYLIKLFEQHNELVRGQVGVNRSQATIGSIR